jgi:hypothetical protein
VFFVGISKGLRFLRVEVAQFDAGTFAVFAMSLHEEFEAERQITIASGQGNNT